MGVGKDKLTCFILTSKLDMLMATAPLYMSNKMQGSTSIRPSHPDHGTGFNRKLIPTAQMETYTVLFNFLNTSNINNDYHELASKKGHEFTTINCSICYISLLLACIIH